MNLPRLTFFVLLLTITLGDPTYQECAALVSTMSGYLTSSETMAYQVSVILALACPQTKDPARCMDTVPDFWPTVSNVLWPWYYDPSSAWFCEEKSGDVTCEECLAVVESSISQMLNDFIPLAIEVLSGDSFCNLEEDAQSCIETVEELIPLAVPAVAGLYNRHDVGAPVCNTALDGVCSAQS